MFRRTVILLVIALAWSPGRASAESTFQLKDASLDIGFWGQAWYQYVSNYDTNQDGIWNDELNDFVVRRAYLSIKGTVSPEWSFFTHFAADRLGEDGIIYNSGRGLGAGLALRDGWIRYSVLDNDVMIQLGRMYIPFTRNYGTTSTKALLDLDLDWVQGGYLGGIFYPSDIGRDDAITVWGNVLNDKLQYRFMIGDGDDNVLHNPDDNPRFAARVSYSVFDAETKWFNPGTYLGKKKVLALGAGMDCENDLIIAGVRNDYMAWTVDMFYDQPIAYGDAVTVQASFIGISNTPNRIRMTWLSPGDEAYVTSLKAGYFFQDAWGAGGLQPYAQYQNIDVKGRGRYDTHIFGFGMNYYLKGAANKITVETTYIAQQHQGDARSSPRDELLLTIQFAAGF